MGNKLFGKRVAVTGAVIAGAKACAASSTCRGAVVSGAKAVAEGAKNVWNKLFGKRIVISASAAAAAAAKAAASCAASASCRDAVTSGAKKLADGVKSAWNKLFGKRVVITASAAAAAAAKAAASCAASASCRDAVKS